jgi:hypothetical protein
MADIKIAGYRLVQKEIRPADGFHPHDRELNAIRAESPSAEPLFRTMYTGHGFPVQQ